jgi:hypothetical protein
MTTSRRAVLGGSAAAGLVAISAGTAHASTTGSGISVSSQRHLQALVQQHLEAEVVARDIDAVMASVASNPVWVFEPNGYIVTGHAAVRESYRRLIAGFFPSILPGENHGQWFSQDGMVSEDDIVLQLPGGGQLVARVTSVLVFDGDLLASERVYLGHGLAPYVRAALGPDFGQLPGVTVSPVPGTETS